MGSMVQKNKRRKRHTVGVELRNQLIKKKFRAFKTDTRVFGGVCIDRRKKVVAKNTKYWGTRASVSTYLERERKNSPETFPCRKGERRMINFWSKKKKNGQFKTQQKKVFVNEKRGKKKRARRRRLTKRGGGHNWEGYNRIRGGKKAPMVNSGGQGKRFFQRKNGGEERHPISSRGGTFFYDQGGKKTCDLGPQTENAWGRKQWTMTWVLLRGKGGVHYFSVKSQEWARTLQMVNKWNPQVRKGGVLPRKGGCC